MDRKIYSLAGSRSSMLATFYRVLTFITIMLYKLYDYVCQGCPAQEPKTRTEHGRGKRLTPDGASGNIALLCNNKAPCGSRYCQESVTSVPRCGGKEHSPFWRFGSRLADR